MQFYLNSIVPKSRSLSIITAVCYHVLYCRRRGANVLSNPRVGLKPAKAKGCCAATTRAILMELRLRIIRETDSNVSIKKKKKPRHLWPIFWVTTCQRRRSFELRLWSFTHQRPFLQNKFIRMCDMYFFKLRASFFH